MKFSVIIPVYNSDRWVVKCLESLINQDYLNWRAVIIDDNSTDNTLEQIIKVIKDRNVMDHYKVLKRTLNVGALENIVYGIDKICVEDDEVICLLDGDDWLASNDVLSYLNNLYENNIGLLMTYGSFVSESGAHNGFCKQIRSTENYRKEEWVTSHLRTFKHGLWKRIDIADLKDSSGKFYSTAWDMAIMYPLIEMSDVQRIKFVEKILYVYNDNNPNNDFRKNVMKQISMANEIKSKPRYRRLG